MKDFFKKNWKNILIILLVISTLAFIFSTKCARENNEKLQNNLKALTDSVRVLTLKNGSLLYEKQSLILEKNELEKYLGISKKEVKELEKKLDASLALISKMNGQIRIDTLVLTDSVYISNDTTTVYFKYNDDWVAIDGLSTVIKEWSITKINTIEMNTPLTIGLTDDYKVYVNSGNPYLTITDIDAAVIENSVCNRKPKRWGIGPYIGIGVGCGGAMKPGSPCCVWSATIGVSIHYSLFQW